MKSNGQSHHKMMIRDFRTRFLVSLILTIPILALSPLIQNILNFSFTFAGDKYIVLAISSFIYAWGGWPFIKGLYKEVKNKRPGMMTLIGVAITVAYVYSGAVVLGLEGKYFFWELATLIDIMLLGHWIEMKSVLSASSALEKLVKLMPDNAHKITDGNTKDVSIEDINKNDMVLVKAGEKIPADGIITEGEGFINESFVTGESEPVKKSVDDEVIGGSVNGDSIIKVKVTASGDESYIKQVIELVRNAQKKKSKTQRFADRAAMWLTFTAISVGLITFVFWISAGREAAFAIERLATVMVITCPHALGLAIPLVTAVSTSISAQNGLLIRNRTAFESAGKITVVVFDKTGTLTEGEFGVSIIESHDDNISNEEILSMAASIEQSSEHPIGIAILKKAQEEDVKLKDAGNINIEKGKGIEGEIGGEQIQLFSPSEANKRYIEIKQIDNADGKTIIVVIKNSKHIGTIALEDKIREESYGAVEKLQEAGIKCIMLTGDNEETAKRVAEELELDDYKAGVLPDEKEKEIRKLQDEGEFVAMTGDGINDAPALARADIGIAVGAGTDIAAETADILLTESNPDDILKMITFGKKTYSKMIQNLFWATGYNVIAIPLAAGVLYNQGIMISPALGAALMSLSTVIVAINAKLLKI